MMGRLHHLHSAAPAAPAAPAVHALFRVRIKLRSGASFHSTRLHASGCEAILQALADHPDARSVSALFVARLA